MKTERYTELILMPPFAIIMGWLAWGNAIEGQTLLFIVSLIAVFFAGASFGLASVKDL